MRVVQGQKGEQVSKEVKDLKDNREMNAKKGVRPFLNLLRKVVDSTVGYHKCFSSHKT